MRRSELAVLALMAVALMYAAYVAGRRAPSPLGPPHWTCERLLTD